MFAAAEARWQAQKIESIGVQLGPKIMPISLLVHEGEFWPEASSLDIFDRNFLDCF